MEESASSAAAPSGLRRTGRRESRMSRMTSSERLTAIRVKPALRSPVIVNLRNIYRPADLAAKGLTYVSVGCG
jgi:hypothetical protein